MDENIPKWSEYFMAIAKTVAMKSKDPNTKVGAIITNKNNKIIGLGFNGMPAGMIENNHIWKKPTKYDYVIHAELNAILNATQSVKGCKLYVTMAPCKECAKLIAAAGIKEVVYDDDKYLNDISQDIFRRCEIQLRQVKPLT